MNQKLLSTNNPQIAIFNCECVEDGRRTWVANQQRKKKEKKRSKMKNRTETNTCLSVYAICMHVQWDNMNFFVFDTILSQLCEWTTVIHTYMHIYSKGSFNAAIVAVISLAFYIPVCFQLVPVINFYLSLVFSIQLFRQKKKYSFVFPVFFHSSFSISNSFGRICTFARISMCMTMNIVERWLCASSFFSFLHLWRVNKSKTHLSFLFFCVCCWCLRVKWNSHANWLFLCTNKVRYKWVFPQSANLIFCPQNIWTNHNLCKIMWSLPCR